MSAWGDFITSSFLPLTLAAFVCFVFCLPPNCPWPPALYSVLGLGGSLNTAVLPLDSGWPYALMFGVRCLPQLSSSSPSREKDRTW